MNLKQKAKTYSFWISIISALIIVVKIVAEQFNWQINDNGIIDAVAGVCSILVVLGILSAPTGSTEADLDKLADELYNYQENQKDIIKEDILKNMDEMTISEQIEYLKSLSAQKPAEDGLSAQQDPCSQTEEPAEEATEKTEKPAEEATELAQEPSEEPAKEVAEPAQDYFQIDNSFEQASGDENLEQIDEIVDENDNVTVISKSPAESATKKEQIAKKLNQIIAEIKQIIDTL